MERLIFLKLWITNGDVYATIDTPVLIREGEERRSSELPRKPRRAAQAFLFDSPDEFWNP